MNLVNEGVLPPDEMDDRDERREEQERARSRETFADIVADIRERAENAMRNGERLVHNEAVANMLTFVADRLEAAAKRDEDHAVEHATRHAEAVARDNCRDCVHNPKGKNYEGGNAAAMREACQKMLDLLMLRGDGKVRCVLTWDEFNESQKMLRVALSRPPRNCDRFADAETARQAWLDDAENWDEFGSPELELYDWLLAPAAERKGEERTMEANNMKAMREALENAYSLLCEGIATEVDDELEHPFHLELACEKIRAALAAPPRNCDAGTPEEQTQRMYAQCCSRRKSCYELPSGEHCPMYREGIDCRLRWAQMPYRAEEGGAK